MAKPGGGFAVLRKLRLAGLLIALISISAVGQDERPIGTIDFYGYEGINLDKIKSTLPIHAGEQFPGPVITREAITKAVTAAIGHAPADIASVCCDARGNFMIYIGLPGTSIKHTSYNPIPKGNAHFPSETIELYEQTMDASTAAVLKGHSVEDSSKGYALAVNDSDLRAKQLAIRAYAIEHEQLIRRVLDDASDARQRIAASYLLGYVEQSSEQIKYLVRASRDTEETVRNNATRALGVLAESNANVASRIPADGFIEMLGSAIWTDRNKASMVLRALTKSRNPTLLARLRSEALTPLLEMARWQNPGHAYNARILLARIAGIDEEHALRLAATDSADEIIKALKLPVN